MFWNRYNLTIQVVSRSCDSYTYMSYTPIRINIRINIFDLLITVGNESYLVNMTGKEKS